jgi:hypothetical protein
MASPDGVRAALLGGVAAAALDLAEAIAPAG